MHTWALPRGKQRVYYNVETKDTSQTINQTTTINNTPEDKRFTKIFHNTQFIISVSRSSRRWKEEELHYIVKYGSKPSKRGYLNWTKNGNLWEINAKAATDQRAWRLHKVMNEHGRILCKSSVTCCLQFSGRQCSKVCENIPSGFFQIKFQSRVCFNRCKVFRLLSSNPTKNVRLIQNISH